MFYLQFECQDWGGEMVDITGSVVVPLKSIVYLRKPALNKPEAKNVRPCHIYSYSYIYIYIGLYMLVASLVLK